MGRPDTAAGQGAGHEPRCSGSPPEGTTFPRNACKKPQSITPLVWRSTMTWISNIFDHEILSSHEPSMEARYLNYIKARPLREEEREGPGATSVCTPSVHRSPGSRCGNLPFCRAPSGSHRSRTKGRRRGGGQAHAQTPAALAHSRGPALLPALRVCSLSTLPRRVGGRVTQNRWTESSQPSAWSTAGVRLVGATEPTLSGLSRKRSTVEAASSKPCPAPS